MDDSSISSVFYKKNNPSPIFTPSPMNIFKTLAMVGLVSVGMAYGENESSNAASNASLDELNKKRTPVVRDIMLDRLQAAKKLPVPIPPTTPYDSDSKKKAVYLEEYQRGYRSILAAVDIGCHMGVMGETFSAYQDGWTDGIKAGKKDHPEKWAEMSGVPLEAILWSQEYKSLHSSPTPQ